MPKAALIIVLLVIASIAGFWLISAPLPVEEKNNLVSDISPTNLVTEEKNISPADPPPNLGRAPLQGRAPIPPSAPKSVSPPPAINIPLPTPAQPPITGEPLTFPAVLTSELLIAQDGVNSLAQYLEYFATSAKNINFDNAKFGEVLQAESSMILLPVDLIEKALNTNDFTGIHHSLDVEKEFLLAKIEFLKKIKVTGAAIKLNQYMIGADRLTLELIDKVFAVRSDSASKAALQSYLKKYSDTIEAYKEKFRGSSLSRTENSNIFNKLFEFLGIIPEQAQAATLGFGGLITVIQECSCLGGYIMYLTPGFVPAPGIGPMFISFATIVSPLLFLNKMPLPGHWILGNYLPTPGPCLSAALCVPSGGFIGIVTLAGTS